MPALPTPDVVVFICANCVPPAMVLPQQWQEDDARILVRRVPCSGKMDAQYLLHAFEGGERGSCVVACPKGECHLAQGNYRAEIRVQTLRRILNEIGLEPERVEILHISPEDPPSQSEQLIRDAVQRICRIGVSPFLAAR